MTESNQSDAFPRFEAGSLPTAPTPAGEPGLAAPVEQAPLGPPPAGLVTSAPRRRWSQKTMSRGLVVVLAPVLAIVMFSGGVFAARSGILGDAQASAPAASAAAAGPDAELALVEQAWKEIQDHYVDAKNLDNQKLAYAAISGIVDAVGDSGHTSFLTAEQAKAMDQSLSGSFVGIGVQVSMDASGKIQISTVFPGTPAEEAGLRRGDHIVAVDGKTTEGETLEEAVTRVRGPEGETVTLTIAREGSPNFDVTITRRKYDLPLVSWAMVPGRDIAMIRLEQFATGATDALKKAITDAKAQGAKAIVFDLRGNSGGYVHEAVGVASQFIGSGAVYQAITRNGDEKASDVQPGGLATDIPMVVLTDGSTASAAEIVTGAIQDAKRGEVVGEKTFGTGTVVLPYNLADGSQVRIGVERWLTRNGRPIWHEGLEPDVKVALADTVQLLLPDDLRDMTAAELAKTPDLQVLKALQLLQGKG